MGWLCRSIYIGTVAVLAWAEIAEKRDLLPKAAAEQAAKALAEDAGCQEKEKKEKSEPNVGKQPEKVWKEKYSIQQPKQPGAIFPDGVAALAVAPNEEFFAMGIHGAKGMLRLSKVQNGETISETEMSTPVSHLAFTPDGNFLVIGSIKKVIIWDWKGKKEKKKFDGVPESVDSIDISRDGKRIAACSFIPAGDGLTIGLVLVWEVDSGKEVFRQSEAGKRYNSVAFSPDGALLAAGTSDPVSHNDPGEIIIWKIAENKEFRRHNPTRCGAISAVAFSPDGKQLAAGGIANQKDGPPKGGTYLWNLEDQAPVGLMPETMAAGMLALAFSPKDKILVSGNWGTFDYWDWTKGTHLGTATTDVGNLGFGCVGSMSFSSSGTHLFVRGQTGAKVQVFTKQ